MNVRTVLPTSSLLVIALLAGCGGSSSSGGGSTPTYTASLSASTLTFQSTIVGQSTTSQQVTLTNTGTGTLSVGVPTISGTNASSFSMLSNSCGVVVSGITIAPGGTCFALIAFTPAAAGTLTATLTFTDSATSSPQTVALAGTGASAPLTYTLTISPTSIAFPATSVGTSSAAHTITVTNTGTGVLSLTGETVTGANSSFFTLASTSTCGTTLNVGSSCVANIVFTPTASGSDSAVFTVTDNASNSPQTVSFTGTAIGSATSAFTIDCSVALNTCADTWTGAFTTASAALPTDPIQTGVGFHGYADPTMRRDPNSNYDYMAYSWAHVLSDGTHVVDLHLAYSSNSGASWTYSGPLWQSSVSTQAAPVSSQYSTTNDSSTETVDLIPIPLTGSSAGQTLWVEAHQSYLVAPQGGIYDQLIPTNEIVVTAVQLATPTAASAPTTMLGLGSTNTQQALLGANGTVANRNVTQSLSALAGTAGANCSNWGQPALWYQSPYLYLAVECTEYSGSLDLNELAHFLYYTTPSGTNPATWTWSYIGIFATPTQAAALGNTSAEATTYKFFTEPEFAATKSGQLGIILTPGVFSSSQQPVIQYGCRFVPITALSPTGITLQTDTTTGALAVIAKVTEADLEGTATANASLLNEGPAACTYEPTAINGIIMGRKYEDDATYGFYIYPLNSTLIP